MHPIRLIIVTLLLALVGANAPAACLGGTACTTDDGQAGKRVCERDSRGKPQWSTCEAINPTPGPNPQPRPPAPAGSYQQSCQGVGVDGSSLVGMCRSLDPNVLKSTRLGNYAKCLGDIMNVDGILRCSQGRLPPAFSYRSHCDFAWMDDTPNGGTLNVYGCRELPYKTGYTLANTGKCKYDILFDGFAKSPNYLVCGERKPPDVSFGGRCQVFWIADNLLHARCAQNLTIVDPATCTGGYKIDPKWGDLVCLPAPSVRTPNLVGMEATSAESLITSLKLTWVADAPCVSPYFTFTVTKQKPAAGTLLQPGDRVELQDCSSTPIAQPTCSNGAQPSAFGLAAQCAFQCTSVQQLACSLSDAKNVIQLTFPPPQCTLQEGSCQVFDVAITCNGVCAENRQQAVDGASAASVAAALAGPQCTAVVGRCPH